MEYATRLFFSVLGEVLRRYFFGFLFWTIVLVVFVATISHLSGGHFLTAAEYTAIAATITGVIRRDSPLCSTLSFISRKSDLPGEKLSALSLTTTTV